MNILANLVIEVPQTGEGTIYARIADVSLPLIYFEVIKGATGLAMTRRRRDNLGQPPSGCLPRSGCSLPTGRTQ